MTPASTRVLVLFGIVAMFGDMTYEGARSVSGPWLTHLGATAAIVSLVAGLGEALGHGLRLLFGRLADRTGAYWRLTAAGYALNLVAIPGLALCGWWPAAAALVILERVGKAVRGPSKSVLVADASRHLGHGRGFAIEEALDQLGAVVGPLIVAVVAARAGGAPAGLGPAFVVLGAPALLALAMLGVTRRTARALGDVEAKAPEPPVVAETDPAARRTWLRFVVGGALLGAAMADWALVAVHLARPGGLGAGWVPILYAAAMATDGGGAWLLGDWFDRRGPQVLAAAGVAAAIAAPLLFLELSPALVVAGVLVWGVALGAQEATLKAAVAALVPRARRGAAYGAFATLYGLSWSAGSAAFGLLYDRSRPALVVLSVGLALSGALLLASVRVRKS